MTTRGEHHWTRIVPPVLVCALLWGSAFPCIKMVYLDWDRRGIEVGLTDLWWFAGIRFTLAGFVLLLLSKQPFADIRATARTPLLLFAVTQTLGQYVFFYIGIALASASLASLLVATGSFWWMLLAPLMLRSPWPTKKQWLAIATGAVGVALATAKPSNGEAFSFLGLGALLISTLMGALGLIYFSKVRPTIGPRAATGFSLFVGGLALLALGGPAFARAGELFSPQAGFLTVWLAFVSASAFTLWNHLSSLHPVNLLASYRFIIPAFGVMESLLLIPGEKATWGLLVGGVLIVASLLVAQRLARAPLPSEPPLADGGPDPKAQKAIK